MWKKIIIFWIKTFLIPKKLNKNFKKNNILKKIKSQEKYYDIICQKTTEVTIPAKSARRAAIKTKRVFFILTALVYNAIVYKVVSVEPIIVELIKPINESTPYFVMISVATAIEALPDIGRRIARGKISEGIFAKLRRGKAIFVIASITPDCLNTLIDKKSPSNVGKMFKYC